MSNKQVFIETYGCQMNFSDSEIVISILKEQGYTLTDNYKNADLILVNTCSIRDHAEQRVINRMQEFKSARKKDPKIHIGVLGCMAERMKDKLIKEEGIDLVVGPDSYRKIPTLLLEIDKGEKAIDVILSKEETYDDIEPIRYESNGVSAFISIMRGCENFCAYCVVPYTRGKERSRNPQTIIEEARRLFNNGYREITLLGQNVNSYKWEHENKVLNFPKLLSSIAEISPLLRIRFATSHPKDLSDELIQVIASKTNICNFIHLPLQAGSNRILDLMNRGYTKEWYLNRIENIKKSIPDVGITTDIIAGFCSETEDEHKETMDMMREVGYYFAYMFKYSERPNTFAWKNLTDDIDEEVKGRRLQEIIDLQQELSLKSNKEDVGKEFEVLVEGISKRSSENVYGRNTQGKVIVFPSTLKPGEYAIVQVIDCTAATLIGKSI